MSTGVRIPRGIDEFNPYIGTTNTYLLAGTPNNGERLGILAEEQTRWSGYVSDWAPLYLKYSDKKNSRTTSIKDQLLEIISNVVAFDWSNHILDRIAASPNVTIMDMETFNIKKGVLQKTTRSISTSPMTELVSVIFSPLGGGTVGVKCYSSTAQRASIYADADSVQYLYAVGDMPPESAEVAGLLKELSTKAVITLSLGSGSSSKKLYIYFRWYNTKRPELSGPWSSLQTSLIL